MITNICITIYYFSEYEKTYVIRENNIMFSTYENNLQFSLNIFDDLFLYLNLVCFPFTLQFILLNNVFRACQNKFNVGRSNIFITSCFHTRYFSDETYSDVLTTQHPVKGTLASSYLRYSFIFRPCMTSQKCRTLELCFVQ